MTGTPPVNFHGSMPVHGDILKRADDREQRFHPGLME